VNPARRQTWTRRLLALLAAGLLLPILLIAIVSLANNREIMGEYRNRFVHNLFAIGTTAIVSILSLLLIGKTIADMF